MGQVLQTDDAAQDRSVSSMTCRGIAYISNLAVGLDARRQGVGAALLHSAEQVLHGSPTVAAAMCVEL